MAVCVGPADVDPAAVAHNYYYYCNDTTYSRYAPGSLPLHPFGLHVFDGIVAVLVMPVVEWNVSRWRR